MNGIRTRGTLAGVIAVSVGCGAPNGGERDPADVVVRSVTVLSPADGRQTSAQSVAIRGDRIITVGADVHGVLGEHTRVVDGTGLFVMPGLWDFHTHLSLADPHAGPLMLTQGVTGARDLGGSLDALDTLRARFWRNDPLGPRIIRVGPTLNGAQYGTHHRVIDTPRAARDAVADLAARGVDILKTHNATGREPYFALLDAAAEAGLQVVGHIPTTVAPLEACEAGQASVDHIVTLFEGVYLEGFSSEVEAFQNVGRWLETDGPTLIDCFVRRGTLFVPTLRTYEARANRAALYDEPPPGWEYLSAANRTAYREHLVPSDRDRQPLIIMMRSALVRIGQQVTRAMHEAGVAIGAGSDFAGPGPVPGFSIHRELELLVEAGLPEPAAIWASARGPGPGAGADSLTGRIEAGAPADLVLLRANPFVTLSALSSIEAVIVRGRVLDRTELDRVLADLAAR